MTLRLKKRWAMALGALVLASCTTQSAEGPKDGTLVADNPRAEDVMVTGSRNDPAPYPPPPPAPPPPPSIAGYAPIAPQQAYGRMAGGMTSAQMAPQPMPGSVDRENYENVDPNPVRAVAQEPVSTFSVDVDTASYSNARRMLTQGRLPPRDSVRVEELVNYFQYDYRLPAQRSRPFEPTVALAPSPWAEGRQLLHIGLQGYNVIPRERPPLNLVLLIDVSGSMQGPDRLDLALQSFRILTEQLTARDRVSIAVYAGAAGEILPPTPGNERARITGALDNLRAGGSTAGGEGLRLAYALAERNFNRNAINRVIIATDGDFNVGINDPEQLQDFVERKRETGIYLSVFGYGGGNYNDLLMQRLAQNGNGVAAYIDNLAEARRLFDTEMASAMFPIANDVKIQVEFNPGRVAEYRLIGYETRMLNREDFNNDQVDAGEIGAGHSVTAIYELTPPGGRVLNEPSRYPQNRPRDPDATANFSNEIAFLRIRYKLPGETTSRLIERPITNADAFQSMAQAPEATRWAAAVAGYGQLLRGDPYLDRGYGWSNVIDLAQGARGRDQYGWRAEFVQLARAASAAAALPTLQSERQPEHRPVPMPTPRPPRR